MMSWLKYRVMRAGSGRLFSKAINLLFKGESKFLGVITYHRIVDSGSSLRGVDTETFESQLNELKRNWNVVSDQQVMEFYSHGIPLPERAVLITFDDGFIENYKNALPILSRLALPSLTFLPSECIKNFGSIWTDQLAYAVNNSTCTEISVSFFDEALIIKFPKQKENAVTELKTYLKCINNSLRLECLSELFIALKIDPKIIPRHLLTLEQVREMIDEGMDIGGHSVSHPILSSLNPEDITPEVDGCKQFINDLGVEALSFCYPNGRKEDYNDDVIDVVKKAGFVTAYTTNYGINLGNSEPYELKRIHAPKDYGEGLSLLLLRQYLLERWRLFSKDVEEKLRGFIGNVMARYTSFFSSSPSIRILMYHRVCDKRDYDQLTVSTKRFEQQIEFLAENFNVVSIDHALDIIEGDNIFLNKIVLTFDDGYLDNLINALPILEKNNLPVCLFITTDFCDGKLHPRYKSDISYKQKNEKLHLNWEQVTTLASHPLITIGSHTVSHLLLQQLKPQRARYEIEESKKILEQRIGKSVYYFSAPNGDYGERELDMIRKSGYRAAVTVSPGVNRLGQGVFELLRTEVTEKDNIKSFNSKLMGGYDLVHKFLDIKRRRIYAQQAYHGDKKLKLLYLMTEPLGIGGVQSDMLALSKEMTNKGHRYMLATQPGEMLSEFEANGGELFDIDFNFSGLTDFYKSVKALRKLLTEQKVDVIAPQSVRSSIVAFVATRLIPLRLFYRKGRPTLPIVTTIHNIHSPMHFKYGGWILKVCADFVIFESNYERDRLLASGLSEVNSSVVHSGIDLDKFKVMPPSESLLKKYSIDKKKQIVLGIVARLSEEKGHQYLLQAFKIIQAETPNSMLMVVGDGPLKEQHESFSQSLGLSDSVIFTGSQRNVKEYLSIFDAFVLSSTRESFPLAAREAMAAGRAVIAPRIGGCGEVVADGETGFLFESANVDDLANKMRVLIRDRRFEDMGIAARKRAENFFSVPVWVEGDEEIYKRFSMK